MKLISLNTWGGLAGKNVLLSFFKKHGDVDIFCLQEIWSDSYDSSEGKKVGGVIVENSKVMVHGLQEITALFPDHKAYFRPHHGDHYGLLILVHRDLEVMAEGEMFVYQEKGFVDPEENGNHARNIQYVTLKCNGKLMTVINFHGLWNGKGKGDSEDRLKQSENIINFLDTLSMPFLIAGDFNLRPDTESVKKFERAGLRNLIKDYGITSTRTKLYTKSTEKFADYVFTSKDIEIDDFKVLPDAVSDHAAMFLNFNI